MHIAVIDPPSTPPERRTTFLGGTALTFLKPRFRRVFRPFVGRLAQVGVTANHVTSLSLAGSLLVGGWITTHADQPVVFALLPAWLMARMCCATIDGALAIDFGQKSRLGGVLIYSLERTDILPADDFGVREGYRALKSLPDAPKPRELRAIGAAWAPHRTIAAWYLWRMPRERGGVLA
jgi:hypothetical protein